MNYSTTQDFTGRASTALETIQSILLPNGFRIVQLTDNRVEFKGRGMNSSKENPLRGATEIMVEIRDGKIQLDARLGGVKFMIIFLMSFPILMAGFFIAASYFSNSGDAELQGNQSWYIPGIWMVISPLFSLWIRKRTVRALDDLMANAMVRAK